MNQCAGVTRPHRRHRSGVDPARASRVPRARRMSTKSPSSVALRQPPSPASITSASSPKANQDSSTCLVSMPGTRQRSTRIAHVTARKGVRLHQRGKAANLLDNIVLRAARQIEDAHAPAAIRGKQITHDGKLGTSSEGKSTRGCGHQNLDRRTGQTAMASVRSWTSLTSVRRPLPRAVLAQQELAAELHHRHAIILDDIGRGIGLVPRIRE